MNSWKVEWVKEIAGKWDISTPEYKSCKARMDKYDTGFNTTWFKAPYKYYIRVRISGIKEELPGTLVGKARLVFEDHTIVPPPEKHSAALTHAIAEFEKNEHVDSLYEAVIGPFQYNVCSYKMDGRKFRVQIIIGTPSSTYTSRKKKKTKTQEQVMGMTSTMMVSPYRNTNKKGPETEYVLLHQELRKQLIEEEDVTPMARITSPPLIIRAKKKQKVVADSPIIRKRSWEPELEKEPQKKKKFLIQHLSPQDLIDYFKQCNAQERRCILNGIIDAAYPMELVYIQHQAVIGPSGNAYASFSNGDHLFQENMLQTSQMNNNPMFANTIPTLSTFGTQQASTSKFFEEDHVNNPQSELESIFNSFNM